MYISTWNVLAYLVISVVVFTKLASLNQPYAHMKKKYPEHYPDALL
jgi:hypothetical protein